MVDGEEKDPPRSYVCGALFDEALERVLLIEKLKPAWQAGRLNFPGGKIEPGESPLRAVVREMTEETAIYWAPERWEEFCVLSTPRSVVHFFRATAPLEVLKLAHAPIGAEQPVTLEVVSIMLHQGMNHRVLPNIPWLIQMALGKVRGERAASFQVTELGGDDVPK